MKALLKPFSFVVVRRSVVRLLVVLYVDLAAAWRQLIARLPEPLFRLSLLFFVIFVSVTRRSGHLVRTLWVTGAAMNDEVRVAPAELYLV